MHIIQLTSSVLVQACTLVRRHRSGIGLPTLDAIHVASCGEVRAQVAPAQSNTSPRIGGSTSRSCRKGSPEPFFHERYASENGKAQTVSFQLRGDRTAPFCHLWLFPRLSTKHSFVRVMATKQLRRSSSVSAPRVAFARISTD
jgi:hypothetical protein